MSIYFGGSRSQSINPAHLPVLRAVASCGQSVHVGCQLGIDQSVVSYFGMFAPSSLVVFAVAPTPATSPRHVQQIPVRSGARVVFSAGGQSAPIPARYLLRSIAAFQGCSQAVFFSPGPGSLAVAREAVKAGIPVFAFGTPQSCSPAPVPSSVGFWVESGFQGFPCWQWQLTVTQPGLF